MEITEENYFALKAEKLTRAQIAEKFEIPDWKLKKLIAANKWSIKRPIIENLNAFSDESEETYYWGGFLGADGNIGDKRDLFLCLHYDDTIMIEQFKSYMKSGHNISSNIDKYYRSEIGMRVSENIKSRLESRFNIVPRKSLIYQLPNIESKENFRHYLRGYFDGDGCICESFSNKNSITATLYTTFTGSNDFIEALYLKLKELLGITGTIQIKPNHKIIKYNTNASIILLEYMYNNSTLYLPRKFALYKKTVIDNNRTTR